MIKRTEEAGAINTPDSNPGWLLEQIENISPVEFEDLYYQCREAPVMVARLTQHSLWTNRGGSRSSYIVRIVQHTRSGEEEQRMAFTPSHEHTVLRSQDHIVMQTVEIPTPLGTMLAGATDRGICLLEFLGSARTEKQLQRLERLFQTEASPGRNPHIDALSFQLKEYFSGARKEFDLVVAAPGTPFQEAVWKELITIPYGETISYQEEAKRIGRPTAVRAVARANGANPISIVIPCHRVIGKNGKLVGYGGGLWRKERLLDLEREHAG